MVKNSERISESFVELVLRSYNENDLKKNKQSIIDLLKAIDGLNSPSPYDQLTTYIFENDKDNADELIALFDESQAIFENSLKEGESYPNIDLFFNSIRRHIKLAIIQQKHIVASSKEALKISEEAEKNINQTERKNKKNRKRFK